MAEEFKAWRIKRGDDWSPTIRFYTDATKAARKDLSGYSAVMEFRRTFGEPVLITLSTADGTITINGLAGEVTPLLSHTASAVEWSAAIADLKLIDAGGRVKHHLQYPVIVDPVVTA